jgi:hypothetical protein
VTDLAGGRVASVSGASHGPSPGRVAIGSTGLDRRALTLGLGAAGLVLLASAAGSGWFRWFDTALAGYLFGIVFFVFGTIYR